MTCSLFVFYEIPLKEDSWVQGITALSESVCNSVQGKFALSNVPLEDQVWKAICLKQPNNLISVKDKHKTCLIEKNGERLEEKMWS